MSAEPMTATQLEEWLLAHGWETVTVLDDDHVAAGKLGTKPRQYVREETITGWRWRIERIR